MSILIKNGSIIDGTGKPRYKSDILLVQDKIAAIGKIEETPEMSCFDAHGLIISPGFIDTHSHSDIEVLKDGRVLPKIMQGITTEIMGQDGISVAPLPEQYISTWRHNLAGIGEDSEEIDWHHHTTAEYLAKVKKVQPSINECYLVPHGNIRMEAMGLENRTPSGEELKQMTRIARREMEGGAVGISSGLIYLPCLYSKKEELISLCKVIAEYQGCFVVHQRSEADTIIDSMKEIIDVARKSGVQLHISHFKVCGKNNWGYISDALKLIDKAEEEGIHVSFDQTPYTAGSTMMSAILPPWVMEGGTSNALQRLSNPSLRKKMIEDIYHGLPGWDNFIGFAGLDQIYVSSIKSERNRDAVGLNLIELGKKRGLDPYNAIFDLLCEEENDIRMIDIYCKEQHVLTFMKRQEMNLSTDGLYGSHPHPRLYGAFPYMIRKYVHEKEVFSLEEAINKMTGKAAESFRIKERGILAPGKAADLTIFDEKQICDTSTFDNPCQYPKGIRQVYVNGVLTVDKGQYVGGRAGRVLTKKNGYIV
ncbi:amidohydrolase family protein [uncultured Megasphaera sp.]|uniref:N-acyl-D-amino-acid deacylase family protein n=1 Tax=uncultured Megasphaera sp. TaxID=165188 RepID=UPI002598A69A|nr:D-aminoacylase [uncultured Megasphaera sp.]